MKNLKTFCWLVLLVFVFFFAYFVKCQLDICFIRNFPLDKFPPFSLLQNRNPEHIVNAPEAGVDLLSNKLLFFSRVGIWNGPWMREPGTVTLESDPEGHYNSSSMVITSRSTKDWSLSHKKLFKATPGEVYSFSGWVKTYGQGTIGSLSVALFDANIKVIQWNYAIKSVSGDNWQKIEQKLTVPSGVQYIQFRLTGQGVGKAWFDGLKFQKCILRRS